MDKVKGTISEILKCDLDIVLEKNSTDCVEINTICTERNKAKVIIKY